MQTPWWLLCFASVSAQVLFATPSYAQTRCVHDAAPPLHSLLRALPETEVGPFAQPLSDVRVVMAELDGRGPSEAVVSAWRAGGTYGPEDLLWVFEQHEGRWRLRAQHLSVVNRASGNVDARGRRGNIVVEGVRLSRGCREVLRVERLRTNYQQQPESSRSFELLALEGATLRPVFGCFLHDRTPQFTLGFSWQNETLSLWVRSRTTHTLHRYHWSDGVFVTNTRDVCHSNAWTHAPERSP